MLPHLHSDARDRDRSVISQMISTVTSSAQNIQLRPLLMSQPTSTTAPSRSPPAGGGRTTTLQNVRCFLSTPFAVITCLLVTAFFFYLMWHPLMNGPILKVVHALEIIDDSDQSTQQPHPHAPVLVNRAADLAEVASWTSFHHHHHHHHQQPLPDRPDPSHNQTALPPFNCYGISAQRGRRRQMEDTYSVYLNHQLHYSSSHARHLMSMDTEEGESEINSPWALFGVYDGHAGALASEYVASYLLPTLHSTLLHAGHTGPTATSLPQPPIIDSLPRPLNITKCFQQTFQSLDEEFIEMVARPLNKHDGSTALVAGIYYRGDHPSADEKSTGHLGPTSSTSPYQLVIGNLGDCRAIMIKPPLISSFTHEHHHPHASAQLLSDPELESATHPTIYPLLPSPSTITPLSIDHKPHLPSERHYIESHPDGFITTSRTGMSRVQGVLAVSRAIGDYPLKPYVRNTPDVHIIDLDEWNEIVQEETGGAATSETQCPFESATKSQCDSGVLSPLASDLLLLASDGFWDAFSNEEAADAITHFLVTHSTASTTASSTSTTTDSLPPSSGQHPIFSSLASHLAKEAYLRGSMDNITVLVVHLECIKRWLRENATKDNHRFLKNAATQPPSAQV